MNTYQNKRNASIRLKALEKMGCKCIRCGWYPSNLIELNGLSFHHTDGTGHTTPEPVLEDGKIKYKMEGESNHSTIRRIIKTPLHQIDNIRLLCYRCHRIEDIEGGFGKTPFTDYLSPIEHLTIKISLTNPKTIVQTPLDNFIWK